MLLLLQAKVQCIRINMPRDLVYGIKHSKALSGLPKTALLQE